MKDIYSSNMQFHTVLLKIKSRSPLEKVLYYLLLLIGVEILQGSKYGNDIQKLPLSNSTVENKVSESNKDYLAQLITRIEISPKFSIQLDKPTDITKLTQLLACVRYVYKENVKEELKDHTRGKDVYCKVDEFLKTEGLEKKNCRGLCTDSAKAMTSKNIGVKSFIII